MLKKWIYNFRFALILIIVILVLFSFYNLSFIAVENLLRMISQASILGITALGLTLVMRMGHYDFSLGAITGLCAIVNVLFLKNGLNISLSFMITILFGIFFGCVNGILISKFLLSDFLVTFSTMFIASGLDIFLSKGGHGISLNSDKFPILMTIGYGDILGIPILVFTFIGITVFFYYFSEKTVLGINANAIGNNERGAIFSGIKVKKIKLIIFVIAGFLYSISGFLLSSRLISVPSRSGEPYFLGSYATVYLGSALIKRKPNVIGTFIASFLMVILENGFSQIGIPFYFQTILKAIVIIFSLFLSLKFKRDNLSEEI